MARALNGPVVLDGIVSDEKLAELLVLGTEYAELDFKRVIDLGEKRQEVELARDVGGMLVRGGYILAGIGPDARPTGDMDGMDLALFDDARLVPKLRTWLPEPLNLVTRVTERGGHKVVLIYVERSQSVWSSCGRTAPTRRALTPHSCSAKATPSGGTAPARSG